MMITAGAFYGPSSRERWGPRTVNVLSFAFAIIAQLQLHSSVGRCDSYEIRPKRWEYRSRYDIGYEVAQATTTGGSEAGAVDGGGGGDDHLSEPILLLNGFGVGSFHQHRLIHRLFDDDDDNNNNNNNNDDEGLDERPPRTVYCIDYLGQGRSWPKDCRDGLGENEKNLQYSADTWCEQIIDFLETIVLPSAAGDDDGGGFATGGGRRRVHLVGNSVGGHLAAHVAVRRPDLVASLCLLNPTPVWGSKLPGWDGHLPAPAIPKAVGRYLFDRIRDLKTIDQFLTATYSRREAFTDELMHQIRGCTLGNGGHAAFASIMWSPPLVSRRKGDDGNEDDGWTTDFQDCLKNVSCDVLLVFGKDDPWCKPAFARNMLLALEDREEGVVRNNNRGVGGVESENRPPPLHRYVEISNAGHCPNHEAPRAVSHLVSRWVGCSSEGDRSETNLDLVGANEGLSFVEEWGETIVRERRRDDIDVGWIDKIVTKFV